MLETGPAPMKKIAVVAMAAAMTAVAALAWSASPARSETILLKRLPLPLDEGLELWFQTHQQRPRDDHFMAHVQILGVERGLRQAPSRLRFRWDIDDRQRMPALDESGTITVTGLGEGRSLNFWWTNGEDTVTDHTQLWLSREACQELVQTGRTRYAIEVSQRHDSPELPIERVQERDFEVEVNGRTVVLPALTLSTQQGDALTILADCDHPLVLDAQIPGFQSWTLKRAITSHARRGQP